MWQLLRRAQVPLTVAMVIAVAYLGYVLLARHSNGRRWAVPRSVTPSEAQARFDATYGGTAVKILQFYVRDGIITEDQSTLLCYGVLNARSVRIDPPVEGVSPALSNCVEIQPEHDTRYTMTVEGKDGRSLSAAVTVVVKPDPEQIPAITAFQVVKHREERGRHYFTIAFRFRNARQVSIDPPVFSPLENSAPWGQWMVAPETTTTYTLTVTGKKGRKASKKLTVEVPKG
jgi:hypothetical protein